MKRMKLGRRIIFGFGSIVLLMLVMAVISMFGNLYTLSNIDSINAYSDLQTSANDVLDIYNETRMSTRILYRESADDAFADFQKQALYVDNRLHVLLATIQNNSAFAEFQTDSDQFASLYRDWSDHIYALQNARQTASADGETIAALVRESRNLDLRAREMIANIVLNVGDRMDRNLTDTAASGRASLTLVSLVSGAALLLAVVLALLIVSSIRKPLGRIQLVLTQMGRDGDFALPAGMESAIRADALGRDEVAACTRAALMLQEKLSTMSQALVSVADGNLTTEVTLQSERDSMGHTLSQMLLNLNQKFSTILQTARQVYGSAQEMDQASRQLHAAAGQQDSEVGYLSDSIAHVAEKTRDNTSLADEAAGLAQTIQHSAHTGSEQMNQMMNAVKEIDEASLAISKIIKVIDDIAFQTNILALNASVEAARAGQHGKGFAVVAEEVRTLAAKSADAAKDTADLIENSIQKATFGADIAKKTAQSLASIVEGIQKSGQIVSCIAEASVEQSEAIARILGSVEKVSSVARETGGMAGHSASASKAIAEQAALLENLVAQFQLADRALPPLAQHT
ncbi:MAG: methyl-accepting chemotaxis protein [Oscillospiraceae bacterium]|jgi:methyl-accepting chemotaxis protein|nr:methyl-accepting chemotaxis protein [Oscillospiraceae bacterium]